MGDITLTIKGPLLKQEYQSLATFSEVVDHAMKRMIEATALHVANGIKQTIQDEMSRSVQLATFVGQSPDPEAIKRIINAIKVDVAPTFPPDVTIEFKDDAAMFDQLEMPEEVFATLKTVIDNSIEKWFNMQVMNQDVPGVTRDT